MSFVTRCPACATHFRVVADQLKISDGWVRCGQCAEVFDASAQLAALPAPEQHAVVPAASEASEVSVQAQYALLREGLPETSVGAPEVPPADVFPVAVTEERPPEPIPEAASIQPVSEPLMDVREDIEDEPREVSRDAWAATTFVELPEPDKHDGIDDARDSMYDLPPAADLLPPASSANDELVASEAVLAAFPEQVGFVRQAQRREGWQRPAMRWSLALVCLLLCLGLLLQWVLFERDRIASLRPDLRPALVALCMPLGCRVEPLRMVQALSIESTTLARRGNGRYALEVVVRNASLFELALPALELSLTDVRDQVLLRRVILPTELPAPPAAVPANDTLTLRVEVLIDAPVGDALAGYRTLVFYP